MNYLLDTNACIALMNGKPASVRRRFRKAVASGNPVFVSSVAAFELWYGAAKSARQESNRQRLQTFFAGPLTLLAFEVEDAQAAGTLRVALEALGTPIAAYDLLIAGQAAPDVQALIHEASQHYERALERQRQGDWAGYGEEVKKLGEALRKLAATRDQE